MLKTLMVGSSGTAAFIKVVDLLTTRGKSQDGANQLDLLVDGAII